MARTATATAREVETTVSRGEVRTRPQGLSPTLKALSTLNPMLPEGWQRFFTARRAGSTWGLSIQCPTCHCTPPDGMKHGYRRWRWMNAHQAIEHPGK